MARVRKPDGEPTFAGSRGNDEVAPITDIPALDPNRGGSTVSSHSLREVSTVAHMF